MPLPTFAQPRRRRDAPNAKIKTRRLHKKIDTTIDIGPGQMLCIPRGAIHRFDNNGTTDVKALCVVTPAAIGPLYFREVAEVFRGAAGGPPDKARLLEIMRRHGLTPALPRA